MSNGKKLAVSVADGTVTIEIICGDAYYAKVLYDDIIERLESGQGISLGVKTAAPKVDLA